MPVEWRIIEHEVGRSDSNIRDEFRSTSMAIRGMTREGLNSELLTVFEMRNLGVAVASCATEDCDNGIFKGHKSTDVTVRMM